MNDNLVRQVCNVLDKYNKTYTTAGVLANLNAWERNKGPLIDLLRKHPNWDESALAVVFEVTQSREIDRYTVFPLKNAVLDLSMDLDMEGDAFTNLNYSLDAATGAYTKLLSDEQVVSSIRQYSGVSCAVGQKTSRAINKICQKYGLDKHPEYNARFAKLADSLNPMQVKRTALLSVHPCDYLEMSNEDNSWRSCHCIREGEYHAGTLSYMNDVVSMIFYTVDEDLGGPYYREPKRTRQVFAYRDGILLQSRLYPHTEDEEARNIYRDIVQRTISHCLNVPNLWKLRRKQEAVDANCQTHADALHYTDYTYQCYKSNVSLLELIHNDDEKSIVIGNTAYCLDCSRKLYHTDSLYCESCNCNADYTTCEDCGERIRLDSDDDFCIGGAHYCQDCVAWCDSCQEYTNGEVIDVYELQGRCIRVCSDCREQYYVSCEDCGGYFRNDCGVRLEDGFHCQDCLDSRYYICSHFGDYVACESTVEIGEKLCTNCVEEVRTEMEEIESGCCVAV